MFNSIRCMTCKCRHMNCFRHTYITIVAFVSIMYSNMLICAYIHGTFKLPNTISLWW